MNLIARYLSRHYTPTPPLKFKRSYINRENRPHPFGHLYNTKAWRLLRSRVLNAEPLCRTCGKLADDVDHIVKHKGDRKLFHDINNLQPLCKRCHKAKTTLERNW